MAPERDDYLAEDGEDRSALRKLLAAGWLRALLLLSALAVVIVISVPYILDWIEIGSAERPAMTDAQVAPPVAAPPIRIETAPAPAAPSPPAPAVATAPAPAAKERAAAKEASPVKDTATTREISPARVEPSAKAPASSVAKDTPVAKAAPVAKDTPASRPSAKAPTMTAKAAAPAPGAPAKPLIGGGSYWVQVGLFENAGNAERLARDLRADRFSVEVVQTTRGGSTPTPSRHEVFVTGSNVETVSATVKGSGGTAQAVTGGVVVRPALDLKDAVTLSRRLASEGLEVRIRRVASAPAGGGTTIHLVRVGSYATPAEAQAGKKDLAAKGIAGFVTQSAPK